ncbi:thioredoxin domain-containing protein, partial [Aestuariivirga sp.]|uniref:thioredoxin domain-containing protein n=1 Tax=Aestuariivirga sp. TaxID=2650926 RepID=UPI003017F310
MKMITRRSILLAGAAAAALAVAPALAEDAAKPVDMADLMKPPTLGDMALGADEGATKVTIVEYASATCPHCAAFH